MPEPTQPTYRTSPRIDMMDIMEMTARKPEELMSNRGSDGVWETRRRPSKGAWVSAATRAAQAAKIDPTLVMAGSRLKVVVEARWRAWENLLVTGRYSISGVAKVSGFHHASVMYAMRRLGGAPSADARKVRRLGVTADAFEISAPAAC